MCDSKQAAQEPYLELVRELVFAYQAFTKNGDTHIRKLGLTPAQFDVIATLGNTKGFSFKELGEKTLITKGTLTGVIDRLEEKGLVQRQIDQYDRRMFQVILTEQGEALFEIVFPAHILHFKHYFQKLTTEESENILNALHKLKSIFQE
jgi:MarR family transcriptional regulator, 2-MHQ and catechol-resistance regulon repressor